MRDVTPFVSTRLWMAAVMQVMLHMGIGYLVGAAFSEHIYMDVSRTEWGNLWVYFWIFFWPFGLAVMFWFWFLVIAGLVAVAYFVKRRLV